MGGHAPWRDEHPDHLFVTVMVHVLLRQHETGYCAVRTLLVTLVVQKCPLGTKHVLASLINITILSNFLTGVHRNVFNVDKVVFLRIHTCFLKIKGIIVVILWWILFLEWRTKYYVFTSETTPSLTVEVLNKETTLCTICHPISCWKVFWNNKTGATWWYLRQPCQKWWSVKCNIL